MCSNLSLLRMKTEAGVCAAACQQPQKLTNYHHVPCLLSLYTNTNVQIGGVGTVYPSRQAVCAVCSPLAWKLSH